MQDPSKAMGAYQKALELDPNNAEANQGYRQTMSTVHSNPEGKYPSFLILRLKHFFYLYEIAIISCG